MNGKTMMKKLYECTNCGFRFYKKTETKSCKNCKKSTVNVIEITDDLYLSPKFDGYGDK